LFANANLFTTGTRVGYAGLPVGHVTAVELRSDAARAQQHPMYPVALTLAVKAGVVLHEDSRVEMKSKGSLATVFSTFPWHWRAPGSWQYDRWFGRRSRRLAGVTVGVPGGVEGLLASLQALLTDATGQILFPAHWLT
jgi:hypothetical protein